MAVVTAGIDADTAAVSLSLGAASTRGANATAANAASTGISTGSAVSRIGGEVTATIHRAAVLDTDRAVRALADAAAALDGNEIAFAHLAARATVVQV
jgi:hypothetical protein